MKSLIVVESPAKVKTIQKYLGPAYKVSASMGHIVDLPKKELGVDVNKNFKPKYIVINKKALTKLKEDFHGMNVLIIASDPDREGEAIGWHVAQRLRVINEKGKKIDEKKEIKRIVFTSITKEAIEEALKNPRDLDMHLIDAQQARRILDRLVGYKLSPLLWKKIRFGLSAGRVQSVAVKFIVDREEEREKFVKKEYWNIFSDLIFHKNNNKKTDIIINKNLGKDETNRGAENRTYTFDGIKFQLTKINDKRSEVKEESEAKNIISEVKDEKWIISEITFKQGTRNPTPPFITSTLQQSASNKFGFSAKKTMQIAQKLYEAGFITYMRTDSTNIVSFMINKIRNYIKEQFGDKYLSKSAIYYKTKSKGAQEAHEAIRPTNIEKDASVLGLVGQEANLYKLIRNRTLASQMSSAKVENTIISIKIKNYIFEANGQRILFEGYLKVYPERIAENILPKLKQGQELFLSKLIADQNFTQPPARYTEATLIKALEKYGIGRPSTYAPIISTIMARQYVFKEGKFLVPTVTAKVVTNFLKKYFEEIVDVNFTANMEDDLDNIAEGKASMIKVINEFFSPFVKKVETSEKKISREEFTVLGDSDFRCPICKKRMVRKLGKFGEFLSCVNFPKCKGIRSIEGESEEDRQNELEKKVNSKGFQKIYEEAPKTDNGRDYVLKKGKFGEFWSHPDYPKVKDARPLKLKPEIIKKVYGSPPKAKDGKEMILRRGRFGEFWSHPNYPEIKEVVRINKKQIREKKRELEQELGIIF